MIAALGLARLGKSVLLIEKDKIGGDCTHTGCIPSKALLHASRAVEQGTIDATEALQYARQKREEIYAEETPEKIEAEGVQVMQGLARFLDEHRLAVTATDGAEELEVSADHIIIATGSHPRKLNRDVLPSIDAKKMHTNESIFELETLPEKLVIVGGGPIGCEMAQAFSALGSEVTLLQRGERLLKDEAEHVSERVLLELESRDVEVRLETEAQDALSEIETADAVLQAIGRVPTLESLELNTADVAHTEHGIAVNDVYQTNQDHIYAIGDCLPRPKFTHLANQQARIAVRDIAFPYLPAQSRGPLPWVTYLKPEIATVGMTFQELEVIPAEAWDTIAISLDETDRSVTENESGEFVTVWHRRFTGEILRATIVAQEAGEMISTYTLAIQEGISLWKFSELIVPYPTKSQALRSIGDQFTFGTLRNLLPEFKAYLWSSIRQLFHLHGRAASAAIFWLSAIAGFSRYLQVTGQDATQFGAVLAYDLRAAIYRRRTLYFVLYL